MAQNNAATDAPIHKDVVAEVARRYEMDEDEVAEFLARANDEWRGLLSELREYHEIVEETDERLIVLAKHGEETREMEKHIYSEMDIDIPDEYGSRANILQVAHDLQAKRFAYDAFDSKQDASDATGAADAVIVSKE